MKKRARPGRDLLHRLLSSSFGGNRTNPAADTVLEWQKSIEEQIERGNVVQFASFSPTDGLMLYRASTADQKAVRSWVGSSESGRSIVVSRRVTGNINAVFTLMREDDVFRRAIIALPDALERFGQLLGLPDRHMWHTCMLALMFERSKQRKKREDVVSIYVSDVFEHHSKIEEHMNDVHSYISAWSKEFIRDFPPK